MLKLKKLTVTSLLISMSLILSRVEISVFFSSGGSVTLFSCVPLIMISFKYGYKWGVVSCGSFGLIHLITTNFRFQGLNLFSVIFSIVLDYIVSYSMIGLSSVFKFKFKFCLKHSLAIGVIFSFFLRLLTHVISGFLIFQPMFKSFVQTIIYVIIYNVAYIVPEMMITLVGVFVIKKLIPESLM